MRCFTGWSARTNCCVPNEAGSACCDIQASWLQGYVRSNTRAWAAIPEKSFAALLHDFTAWAWKINRQASAELSTPCEVSWARQNVLAAFLANIGSNTSTQLKIPTETWVAKPNVAALIGRGWVDATARLKTPSFVGWTDGNHFAGTQFKLLRVYPWRKENKIQNFVQAHCNGERLLELFLKGQQNL